MIYSLTGKIIKKTLNAVVICCGGVGYYAQCPASVAGALPGVGREATIYTVMSVTENDVSLYGFATEEQQACFEMLTAVSGVGPKVGLAILSVMEPDRVALAISAGDHKAFKAASGVAVFLTGIGLDLIGLVGNTEETGPVAVQSAGTLLGLRLMMTVLPMLVLAGALVLFRRKFVLTDARAAEISAQLHREEAHHD